MSNSEDRNKRARAGQTAVVKGDPVVVTRSPPLDLRLYEVNGNIREQVLTSVSGQICLEFAPIGDLDNDAHLVISLGRDGLAFQFQDSEGQWAGGTSQVMLSIDDLLNLSDGRLVLTKVNEEH